MNNLLHHRKQDKLFTSLPVLVCEQMHISISEDRLLSNVCLQLTDELTPALCLTD